MCHSKTDFNKNWINRNPQPDIETLFKKNTVAVPTYIPTKVNTFSNDTDENSKVLDHTTTSPKQISLYDRIIIAHKRLGHLSYTKMMESLRTNAITGLGISYEELKSHGHFNCHSCILAKMDRLPRYPSTSQSNIPNIRPGSKWGLDIKPGLTRTLTGETMTLSCVDFGSGATFHFPMKYKYEVTSKLLLLNNFVKRSNLSLDNISVIQSDDEPIFISGAFYNKCQELNITLQHSSPYVKEQNGLVEAAIKTDFATARAMMFEANVKPYLWNHALRYVSYIRFRTVGSPVYGRNVSPYFLWYNSHPDVSHIRTWGSPAYYHNPAEIRSSVWDPKAYLGILIGIVPDSKYCYYIAKLTRPFTIVQRSDVIILENIPTQHPFSDSQVIKDKDSLLLGQPHPRKFIYSPNHSSPDFIVSQVDHDSQGYFITTIDDSLRLAVSHPQLYLHQAMNHPAKEHFLIALREEFTNLMNLGVFRFVEKKDIPNDVKVIPLMAVFKVSTTTDPSKVKVKSRIVVLGNKIDKYGMITFSPTVQNFTTLLFFALLVQLKNVCISTDFVQAYLHAPSRPGIYVSISSYMTSSTEEKYAELLYALYGLPDSGKVFNDYFHSFITELGYERSIIDPCLYFKRISDTELIIFIIYVDDIAVQGPTLELITIHFLEPLKSKFRMTHQDNILRYLSMQIHYDKVKGMISIGQAEYINYILQKFGISKGKLVPIPSQLPSTITVDTPTVNMPTGLMEQVGCLRYLADHSRPDIQLSSNRAVTDITGTFATHCLQYLSITTDLNLQYRYDDNGIQLHGYADASWKIPPLAQSFISYVIFLNYNSGTIESVCKRLVSTVPQSIMEAELFAIYELLRSLIRTRNQLIQMHLLDDTSILKIYTDSESSMHFSNSVHYSSVNRHFLPKLNLVRQYVQSNKLQLIKVNSFSNVADINTKALPVNQFQKLRTHLLTGVSVTEENV